MGAPVAEPVKPDLLVPGARVRVRGLAQPAVIRQLAPSGVEGRGGTAEVQAGPLRMKIQLSDVVEVVGAQGSAPAGVQQHARTPQRYDSGVTVHAQPADASDDINVIGLTVEEATARVDKFLDNAALAGKSRVRIIHGHGTGALRRGLSGFLVEHPHVERFHDEDPERGGSAITVVELKG